MIPCCISLLKFHSIQGSFIGWMVDKLQPQREQLESVLNSIAKSLLIKGEGNLLSKYIASCKALHDPLPKFLS